MAKIDYTKLAKPTVDQNAPSATQLSQVSGTDKTQPETLQLSGRTTLDSNGQSIGGSRDTMPEPVASVSTHNTLSPGRQAIGYEGGTNSRGIPTYEDAYQKLGTPKVYESVGEAGSGWTNLSHLLGLNRGSGENSAKDFANRTNEAGTSAKAGISGAENSFMSGITGFQGSLGQFDPGASDAQDFINNAKNAKYTGPGDLTENSGYADLAKKVGSAQDMAKNATGGWSGMAAQVNKDTGLSPKQSAASAFYMGVNNPNLKRAGAPFVNLQNALDQANTRAVGYAGLARKSASDYAANAPEWQKELNDYNASAAKTEAAAKARTAQAANDAEQQTRQDTLNKNGQDEHRTSEVQATSEMNWAIKKGMPADIAYMGVSYDDWVAMGKPSWPQYLKDHPEADRSGSK